MDLITLLAMCARLCVALTVIVVGGLRTLAAFGREANLGSLVLPGPLTGLLFLALAGVFATLWYLLQRRRGGDPAHMLVYEFLMAYAYLVCQSLLLPK